MQSPKYKNLICRKNAVTHLFFKWSWPKLQVHNPPWWQRSIQSLRKIHWKIAEKNSGQTRTDGQTDRRTDRQTDRQTGWFQYTPPQLVGGGYNKSFTSPCQGIYQSSYYCCPSSCSKLIQGVPTGKEQMGSQHLYRFPLVNTFTERWVLFIMKLTPVFVKTIILVSNSYM